MSRRRTAGERSPAGERRDPNRSTPAGGWLYVLLIAAAPVLVYWNALPAPFMFDDLAAIVQNETIRDLSRLPSVLSPPENTPVAGRPLVNLSFALNYASAGLDVRWYRATNLALHIASALVLFALVRRTTGATDAAGAASLLWVTHPLNTEVVDYITQRTEGLMALCYLTTLFAARAAARSERRTSWTVAAVAACAAGMACKETMVTAPLLVVLYDRVFLFDSVMAAVRQRWRLYTGLAATWAVLLVLVSSRGQTLSSGFSTALVSPWTYLLNQTIMLARYLRLAVWPDSLVLYYGWPLPLTLRDVWPYALLVLGLVILTALVAALKRRLGFLFTAVFITLAPTTSVLPIATEVGAERRMYLALCALAVAAAMGLQQFRRGRVLLAALVLIYGGLTIRRNAEYSSPLRMAETVAARWPTANAHYMVGTELAAAGRHPEALAALQRAAPGYPPAYYPLGVELLASGRTDEGIQALEAFVQREPDTLAARSAHATLANSLAGIGQFARAIPHYRAYLQRETGDARAWTGLGIALVSTGDLTGGLAAFREAVGRQPRDFKMRANLARAFLDSGLLSEAAAEAEQARRLAPDDPAPDELLGRVAARQGRLDLAATHFRRSLQLDPTFQPAIDGLAAVMSKR
jgi:protein O-mannosyl-transferase